MPNLSTELVVTLITVITALFKTFKFVQEGEQGVKLTFGKAKRDKAGKPKIIPAGFALLVPWMQTLKRHHVRQQTHRLDHQSVTLSDGLIYEVGAIVILKVTDIYKALFEIENLDQSIVDLSMGVLREVLSAKKHTELHDMRAISGELLDALRHKTNEWGVELIQFNLTDCAPSKESAPLVNAEAGVRLRLEALKRGIKDSGMKPGEMSEMLAAVLIGTPLVAAVTPQVHISTNSAKTEEVEHRGLLDLLFNGSSDSGTSDSKVPEGNR